MEEDQKQEVNVMLYYSVNISRAYWYKEQFLKIITCKDAESAKTAMKEWIENAENCDIAQFEKCAQTMRNWPAISPAALAVVPATKNFMSSDCCRLFSLLRLSYMALSELFFLS